MKNLYHEKYETYLDDARELEEETSKAVKPILEKYAALGYSVRQISQIMAVAVEMEEGIFLMTRNGELAKEELKGRQYINKQNPLYKGK
jgi:hypothetical protein